MRIKQDFNRVIFKYLMIITDILISYLMYLPFMSSALALAALSVE